MRSTTTNDQDVRTTAPKRRVKAARKVTGPPDELLRKRIWIEKVSPAVDAGTFAAKAVAGDVCVVEADLFRDGHDKIRADVKWRAAGARSFQRCPMHFWDNDRWRGTFPLEQVGLYEFGVETWTDRYATWLDDLRKRVEAGMTDVASEVKEGAAMIEEVARTARGKDREVLQGALDTLRHGGDPASHYAAASDGMVIDAMARLEERPDTVETERLYTVWADRPRARFGAWYELFVRSQTDDPKVSGTFRGVEERFPDIRDMGFDVVYLTPIHPVGRTARKGPNNTLKAGPNDPGSPWAIGNEHGGHTAIEPSLGTIEDFDRMVEAAQRHDLEIALDFAIQCSPDHPWVKQHPEWFRHRPDGTIKYAENPPKKYQDIYPVNFDNDDAAALWEELRQTLLYWIGHGVKIFRVDNPHTKPFAFWQWVIARIHDEHPDVLFLSEAFTRPKVMNVLAKVGFTQSYTYFTWRNTKHELTEYLEQLAHTEMNQFFRPNFFVNTPDILHEVLQTGGPPMFKTRLALAATLSPTYGIYSGYELCENQAVPGTEEYLHSEKYEIRVRDWHQPGNLREYVARFNRIRREHPALHDVRNVRFYPTDNDHILCYAKRTDDRSDVLIVVVNLDPHHPHHATVSVPLEDLGVSPGGRFAVRDLLDDAVYEWGASNYVRLDPAVEPVHVFRVERRA